MNEEWCSALSDRPYDKPDMTERSTDHEYLQYVPRPIAAMAKDYPASYAGYVHTHARGQLLYAASGTMKVFSKLGSWIVPPQRAVWFPPHYPHQTSTINAVEMRTIYIREDMCPPKAPNEPRMLAVTPLLRELILRLAGRPVEYDENGHDGRLAAALLGEIDWTPLHPVSLPVFTDPRLRVMEKTLQRNPGNTRTLDEWAARLQCSPRTLGRLFLKEAGISFQSWKDQMRTYTALTLLAEEKPLSEIADELGFETAWAFTSMFRRVTGQLPSKYRSK